MRRDIIEYLSDTVLIEKMSEIEPSEITKKAGLFDELGLSSVASSIKNAFHGKTFLDIMTPGILFKIHPLYSLIYFVAQRFLGFDINSVVSSIIGKLRPKLESGAQVTADEVNSAGKEVISSLGGSMQATASDNPLAYLYDLDRQGFFKEAQFRTPDRISFFGSRTGNRWASVFGDLLPLPRRGKLVWLIGGIIIWTVKTALLGAGLLVGASAVNSMLGSQKKIEEKEKEDSPMLPGGSSSGTYVSAPTEQQTMPASYRSESLPLLIKDPFRASGWGQKHFPNDKDNVWVVPLINRSIDDTLLTWTVKVYPELSGKEYLIESTNSFQRAVDDMSQNLDPTSDTFSVPESVNNRNVHSIKDVVDTFTKEVARRLT